MLTLLNGSVWAKGRTVQPRVYLSLILLNVSWVLAICYVKI